MGPKKRRDRVDILLRHWRLELRQISLNLLRLELEKISLPARTPRTSWRLIRYPNQCSYSTPSTVPEPSLVIGPIVVPSHIVLSKIPNPKHYLGRVRFQVQVHGQGQVWFLHQGMVEEHSLFASGLRKIWVGESPCVLRLLFSCHHTSRTVRFNMTVLNLSSFHSLFHFISCQNQIREEKFLVVFASSIL